MANKKYYWLKLQKDFFKRHDIRIVESMPNGKDYILFYLKLLLESVTHEGSLRFSDTIPYSEEMLATITNTNIDVVRAAMGVFKQLNMVEILDDATIFLSEVTNMTGCESSVAERVRKHRDNQKLLHCNNVKQNCNTEIEIELEKEIDKDIDIKDMPVDEFPSLSPKEKKHKYGNYKHVQLKDSELSTLKTELGEQLTEQCISFLDEYIEMKGYKAKSHYLCIKKWVISAVKERQTKDSKTTSKPTSRPNKFHNFTEREYTDEQSKTIEQKLLERSMGNGN